MNGKVLSKKNVYKLFYKIIYDYFCFFWTLHKRKIALSGILVDQIPDGNRFDMAKADLSYTQSLHRPVARNGIK